MAVGEIDRLDNEMRECVNNCFSAAQVAEWCADECIQVGDPAMARCIELCRDVADLTQLHAVLMVRDSEYHRDLAAVCADACADCADECAGFDMEHCQVCADVLEECADSCRAMAQ